MFPVLLVIFFVIGTVIGHLVSKQYNKPLSAGTLVVYKTTDGDPPSLFLDLDEEPDDIGYSKYVVFKVESKVV